MIALRHKRAVSSPNNDHVANTVSLFHKLGKLCKLNADLP
jgi:hypothetical protein